MDLAPVILSIVAGGASVWLFYRLKRGSLDTIGIEIVQKAEREAQTKLQEGELALKESVLNQHQERERLLQGERKKLQKESERLKAREDKLEVRMHKLEEKQSALEKRETLLKKKEEGADQKQETCQILEEKLKERLERVSLLTSSEARDQLFKLLCQELDEEKKSQIAQARKKAEREADEVASRIIATAINRLAVSTVSTATLHSVSLPNDEMKGRIIGREGRNIRALEQATGVNILIDETPGAVVVSGFDPIRIHVAKYALTALIQDGRIHPTRIEEAVAEAEETLEKEVCHYGEEAAVRVGVVGLHPEIIQLLGKLKFRTSYGQNVLEHSIEVAHLMGIMAAELQLDCPLAKRIGLLHDMGKAVTHEVEGSHALIGHDRALQWGESEAVANGIGCHHREMKPITVEGSLCQAADAISGSRTGARIEAVEEYVRRLKKLEEFAYSFHGVEKAYALQAGREIRVIVLPEHIDDFGAATLARDLKGRIESELRYPGKVKVTVVRETRVTEYAH